MAFLDPTSDFRFILPAETDANSPLSEELMSQYRENIEANFMDTKYVNRRFEVVSVDSDTVMTVQKVDSGDPDWSLNEFTGLIVTMQSGLALGNNYKISLNDILTTGTATITFTGTTLTGDNIAAGDIGYIMYAFTGYAHTHDGIDSAPIGAENLINQSDRVVQNTNPTTYVLNTDDPNDLSNGVVINRTEATNKVYGYVRFDSGTQNSAAWSGAEIWVRLIGGTYYYYDSNGVFTNYPLPANVDGPIFTLGTIPPVPASNTITANLSKADYSIDLGAAGVPLGAPVRATLMVRRNSGAIHTDYKAMGYLFTSA